MQITHNELGSTVTHPLKAGGENIPVTKENRRGKLKVLTIACFYSQNGLKILFTFKNCYILDQVSSDIYHSLFSQCPFYDIIVAFLVF